MDANLNGRWDATAFFEQLCEHNRLARQENFVFCRCSGLEGFEEALTDMQTSQAICAVSDIADGYTDLNNTPRTRRVKTIFLAMRHAAEDMEARNECMEIMRELFRQFMSRLILEKVKLEERCIYLDPRISFNEIDRYFFSGCACAYFQIAVDCYTDLRHNNDEWIVEYDPEDYSNKFKYELWIISYSKYKEAEVIKIVREILIDYDIRPSGLMEAQKIVRAAPCIITANVTREYLKSYKSRFDECGAIVELR